MHRVAGKIHNRIKKARRIALISHINPDGDALGSLNAMAEYLHNLDKETFIFSATDVDKTFNFLPHHDKIILTSETLPHEDIDLIVILDSGDIERTGLSQIIREKQVDIINIDHHATNDHYGHINLVMEEASATTEVLYRFFRYNRIEINRDMANSILTGLVTDTDNFTNGATTAMGLAAAGEMTRFGANLRLIRQKTQQNKTLDTLKLWGVVLSRLKKEEDLELAHTYITQEDFKKYSLSEEAIQGVAGFLNDLQEAKIIAVLKEVGGNKVKVSFRTTHDHIDVAALAQTMGGGGHKKAAGVTMDGSIKDALDKILTEHRKLIIIK